MWDKKDPDGRQKSAWALMAFIMFFTFVEIIGFVEFFTGYKIPWIDFSSKLQALVVGGVFLMVSYFLFLHDKRYIKIIKKFANEDERSKRRGEIFAFGYVYALFVIPIISIFLYSYFYPTGISANENKVIASSNKNQVQAVHEGPVDKNKLILLDVEDKRVSSKPS